jgi:hypothetical protein
MKTRQTAFLTRIRALVTMAVAAAGLAACSSAPIPTMGPAVIYGVLYGHVTAPAGRTHVSIQGRAYSDSADALAFGTTTGILGAISIPLPADSTNYNSQLLTNITEVVYLSVFAQGQVSTGVVNSDTLFALRIRLDSLGGALGHDSVAANFTLP